MTNSCSNKSVLIVEDHPVVAKATQILLSRIDKTLAVTICDSATSALEEYRSDPSWSRIFLDLDVPGAYGLSLARQFCEFGVANRCAVITASNNPSWIAEAEGLGMIGYILKATPVEEFSAALKAILDGRRMFPRLLTTHRFLRRLTRRQHDVLSLLHRGYSSKQIAAQLRLSEGTVNNHVTGLLQALEVSNRTHAIAKALELGYIQTQ